MVVAVALATTSCVKDWNCVCVDGSNSQSQTFKNMKFTEAVDKCDDKEAVVRLIWPNAKCSIK
ncbi:MAG: hypothetical protein U0U67_16675 [Chitinophagales bacterium]